MGDVLVQEPDISVSEAGSNTAFKGSCLYYSNVLRRDTFTEDEEESVLWEIATEIWGGNISRWQ